MSEPIACRRCDGVGGSCRYDSQFDPIEGSYEECDHCNGDGVEPCEDCGEAPAVVFVGDKIPVCEKCAKVER